MKVRVRMPILEAARFDPAIAIPRGVSRVGEGGYRFAEAGTRKTSLIVPGDWIVGSVEAGFRVVRHEDLVERYEVIEP